jgi:hypothetical protein
MIILDRYTGRWQASLNPTTPSPADEIRQSLSVDDREWSEFLQCLERAGLDVRWSEWDENDGMDVYVVIAKPPKEVEP